MEKERYKFYNRRSCEICKRGAIYGLSARVFTVEYLIASFLLAFGQKDRERVLELIEDADGRCLE